MTEKKTTAKKSKPKAAAKKSNGHAGKLTPRIVLSEKQLGESRDETVRVRPSVMKMVETFAKSRKGMRTEFASTADAVEHLLVKAIGRQNAVDRHSAKS